MRSPNEKRAGGNGDGDEEATMRMTTIIIFRTLSRQLYNWLLTKWRNHVGDILDNEKAV